MASLRFLAAIGVSASLAACAAGPDYRPPAASALGVPGSYSSAAPAVAPVDLSQWWTQLGDPVLVELVTLAGQGNTDIAQAVARLRQAREGLVQARADLVPQVDASGGYNRNFASRGPDSGSFSIGADASYQADLFGGVRRSIEAARGAAEASGYDLAAVRVSVAAEVARNYIAAREAQANLAVARESLAIADDNLEIAGFRVQAGLVSSLDREQARSQRAQTAAQIPSSEQQYQAALHRLGVLTGQAPGALKARLAVPASIPAGPAGVAVGIPADTLRQRPDVRAAERRLASATAEIGVAQSALYPALNIGGNIGTAATSIGGLADLITGSLFAGLSQLIFDGGRTRSRVRAQEAAAEAALAVYRGTVLVALEDVENGLAALNAAEARQREFAVALDAAGTTALLARSQYRAGLTDFTTLNNAESALLSARNGVTSARAARVQALVQLYAALGGGWDGVLPAAPGN